MSNLYAEYRAVDNSITTKITLENTPNEESVLVYYQGMGGFVRNIDYAISGKDVSWSEDVKTFILNRIENSLNDIIVVYYTLENEEVICASKNFTLSSTDISNKSIDLSLDTIPSENTGWIVDLFAGPNQFTYNSVITGKNDFLLVRMGSTSSYKLSWLGLIMEESISKAQIANPLVDITIRVTYAIDVDNYYNFTRTSEIRHITALEASNYCLTLKHAPMKASQWEFQVIPQGGPSQLMGKDVFVHGKSLWWLPDTGLVENSYVNIIYYTGRYDLSQRPVKAIVQMANSKGHGICPKLKDIVRHYGAASQNVVPTEKAIRAALDEFTPSLTFDSSPGISFLEDSSSNITTKSFVKKESPWISEKTVNWSKNETSLYINGLSAGGDYTWLTSKPSSIVISTSAESEIIPVDPKWIKSPCAGGSYSWNGSIIEKAMTASGELLFSVPSGSFVGGVKLYCNNTFNTSADIYSIGTDFDREALTRKFYAPTSSGAFNQWEPGQTLVRDGWVYFSEPTDIKIYCWSSARELRSSSIKYYDNGQFKININYDVIDWNDYARCYVAGTVGFISEFSHGVGGMAVKHYQSSNIPSLSAATGLSDIIKNEIYFTGGNSTGSNYLHKWNRTSQTGEAVKALNVTTLAYMGSVGALGAGWLIGGINPLDTTDLSENVIQFKFDDETTSFYKIGISLNPVSDFGCALVGDKALIIGGESYILNESGQETKTPASEQSSAFNCRTKLMESIAGGISRTGLRGAALDSSTAIFIGGYEAGSEVDDISNFILVGQPTMNVDLYDNTTTTFKSLSQMPYGTARSAVMATPSKIHVIGGETYKNSDGTCNKTGAALTYDVSTSSWSMNSMRSNLFSGAGYTQL